MVSVVDIHRYAEPVLSSAELETLEIADRGSELRIIITAQGCHGKPYLEIINYADEIDADLIVLCYHGYSRRMGAEGEQSRQLRLSAGDKPPDMNP